MMFVDFFALHSRENPSRSSFPPFDRLRAGRPAAERESSSWLFGFTRAKRRCREVSSASAAAELLSLACPRERNQREGHPALAPDFVRCPALLAGLGPARTRTSMCSNMRAFPPSPPPLLGAIDGKEVPRATARAPLALVSRRSRRRAGGSVRSIARRKRACFPSGHGCAVGKPRRPAANPAQPGAISGSPFSCLLLFRDAKRSRSAAAEADETSAARLRQASKAKTNPRLRRGARNFAPGSQRASESQEQDSGSRRNEKPPTHDFLPLDGLGEAAKLA